MAIMATVVCLLYVTCFIAAVHAAMQSPASLQFYLHETSLYANASLNTATVDVPASSSEANRYNFGELVILDDPLTAGPSMDSPRIGSAQGLYVYCGRSNYSAFWAVTAFLPQGSLSFMGAEITVQPQRFLPIVGGTGEFANARGVATLTTVTFSVPNSFVLSFDVKLMYSS